MDLTCWFDSMAELEVVYAQTFPKYGSGGKPFQLLYGAQLIKQQQCLSDAGVVEAIRDTPSTSILWAYPNMRLSVLLICPH